MCMDIYMIVSVSKQSTGSIRGEVEEKYATHEHPALHWQSSPQPQFGLPHPDMAMVMSLDGDRARRGEMDRRAGAEESKQTKTKHKMKHESLQYVAPALYYYSCPFSLSTQWLY